MYFFTIDTSNSLLHVIDKILSANFTPCKVVIHVHESPFRVESQQTHALQLYTLAPSLDTHVDIIMYSTCEKCSYQV